MKKELNYYLIPTIIIAGFIFLFFIINFQPTGKIVEEPYTPSECSYKEIKEVWEDIFRETSDNLTINHNSSSLGYEGYESPESKFTCPIYIAYKVNGSQLKMLYESNLWFMTHMKILIAVNGNFSQETIENLTNPSAGVNPLDILGITGEGTTENQSVNRGIGNTSQAKSHFESIFKISSDNWQKNNTEDGIIYSFSDSNELGNISIFGETINPEGIASKSGMVFQNKTIDMYIFSQASMYNLAYLKKYEKWTAPINTSLENITVKANNSKIDVLHYEYYGPQEVEIIHGNKVIVKTKANLTGLDWTKINLKKQDISSEFGYVIINGLNFSKNITVDKLNEDSESVCIKDEEVTSINEISDNCNSNKEYLLECPGNLSNFTCEIINNGFFVTGLMHSAVLEFVTNESEICLPNWQCGSWSNQEENCGYRNCIDLNNCGNFSEMPLEYLECPEVCVPNWDCTDWEPEKCPKEEIRTRICEDLNDCGSNEGKPATSQECERKLKDRLWFWILLGGLFFLLILILIISLSSKKKPKITEQQPTAPYSNPEYPTYGYQRNQNYQQPQQIQQSNIPQTNLPEKQQQNSQPSPPSNSQENLPKEKQKILPNQQAQPRPPQKTNYYQGYKKRQNLQSNQQAQPRPPQKTNYYQGYKKRQRPQ